MAKNEPAANKVDMSKILKAKDSSPKIPGTQDTSSPDTQDLEAPEDRVFHVFHCNLKNSRMVTHTGRGIIFANGKCITESEEDIDYLNEEIAKGNMHIKVIKDEETIKSSELDPMTTLRRKVLKDLIATQAELARKLAAGEPLTVSEYEMKKLMPTSTANVASAASASDSQAS